ncbi:TetR/AcrR family transcriptional regulator [Flavobacterium taihuense]|uniref:TetR/AcrR family transcriptional regulator n=1 Tax=Flavobacterium taihuense TaxID=2857508 RepID=A0ABS6XVC0_9FLAO|nr:TetR/AcrR family transcriptional regulator [Flavobacterium taihuense]MBW4360635.1 TetR/AcrR family transcriptional regulator [Flavobacterium taihuense]
MARNREFNTDDALDKAMLLFWNKGFNGVSTQEIIDDLNISKSSMYGAFGDKMELFTLTLLRYSSKIIVDINNEFEISQNVKMTFKKILSQIYKEALSKKLNNGCFIVNSTIELAPHNKKIAKIVSDHRTKLEDIFENAINKAIEKKQVPATKNAKQISCFFCNTINGMYVDSKYIRTKTSYENTINTVIASLD